MYNLRYFPDDHNGYLTTAEAARIAACTQTHIGRICRSGEVLCRRLGREWFVGKESLEAYLTKVEVEKRRRAEMLSEERRREYHAKTLAAVPPRIERSVQQRSLSVSALIAIFLFFSLFAAFGVASIPRTFSLSESSHSVAAPSFSEIGESIIEVFTSFTTDLRRVLVGMFGSREEETARIESQTPLERGPLKTPPPVLVPPSDPASQVPASRITENVPRERTVIENVTNNFIVSGVTESELTAAIQALEGTFNVALQNINRVVGSPVPYSPPPSSGGVANVVALMNNIDMLSGVQISGGTISGASISGGSIDIGALVGTLSIAKGGTGTSTAPNYGQVLLGNALGTYDLVATSSLGITGGGGSTFGQTFEIANGALAPTTTVGILVSASSTITNLTTINATSTNATTTNLAVTGSASTSNLVTSNSFTFSNVTGFLKATAGAVATSLINLASDITGILPVGNGGTGWGNVQANTVLLGNGTGAVATTSAGTNGFVLALVNGVPTWQATTTLSTISGTLGVASGGTGNTSFTSSQLLYGNGTAALSSVATTSVSLGLGLSHSGTFGSLVGGSSGTLSIATSSLFSGTAGQFPYFSGTNTLVGTSSIFIATSGSIGVASTTPYGLFSIEQDTEAASLWIGNTGSTTPSLVVRGVNGNGHVGIGIVSPTVPLHVPGVNSTNVAIISNVLFERDGSGYGRITEQAGWYRFTTSGSYINGTFGIRDTSPDAGFEVSADGSTSGNLFLLSSNDANDGDILTITEAGRFGFGTTTPQWSLQIASSSASATFRPQLTLSDTASASNNHWSFANIGGNFFLATSSASTFATTSTSALEIAGGGFGTTTVRGLNIVGQATSTSNVGFNITSGCFAISNVCVGGGGVTSIQQTYGTAQTGAITFATSSATTFNGLTISNSITNSGGTFTFAPNSITGTLTVAGGGTGAATFTNNRVLTGNGTSALVDEANLTFDGSLLTVTGNASTTQISSTGAAYFATSGGSVGIGETSPLARLHVKAAITNFNAFYMSATDNGALAAVFSDGSENAWFRLYDTSGNEDIRLNTAGDTYFNGGSVGVGTTTPWRKLSVTDAVSTAQFAVAYDTTRYSQFLTDSAGNLTIDAQNGGVFMLDENLFVCTGGSCPSGSPSGNGNVIAETAIGVASSTPWAGLSLASGKAIVVGENTLATSTSITVDWRNGNQQLVRLGTAATTITFSGFIEGQKLVLTVCNPNATAGAISWGTQVLWPGGAAPTQTTTANKCDVWSFLATMATTTVKIFGAQTANF